LPKKEKLFMVVTSFLRRQTSLLVLASLLVLVFALSACGGSDAPAASTSSGSSSSSSAPAPAAGGATQKVTITEQTGGNDVYSFAPATLSIKAGDSVQWVNNSDENHKLAISPAGPTAGTVTKSGSNDNTLTVKFPTAGTYTVTSQLVDRLKDGKHTPDPADSKATITITVG
jgi:plastocyanin